MTNRNCYSNVGLRVSQIVIAVFSFILFLSMAPGCDSFQSASEGARNEDAVRMGDRSEIPSGLIALQDSLSRRLLGLPEIIGTGLTEDKNGNPALVVIARSEPSGWPASKRDMVPQTLGDLSVYLIVTGEIHADRPSMPKNAPGEQVSADDVSSGTAFFQHPVPLGVSTGHPDISAGTIGARVTDGTNVYVLSNNHIYANRNSASIGDPVLQPGRVDGGETPQNDIGNLARIVPIDFSGLCVNTVDAAVALTTVNMVGTGTPSDGYGHLGCRC